MNDEAASARIALGPAVFGWNKELGLSFVKATADEVIAEVELSERHHQPMGIVHGGVYCALVETVCSVGGHLAAERHGNLVVGVDNHTSFLKAQRTGKLRTIGVPLARGRRTQLWEAKIENEAGVVVATGRVRLVCLEAGSQLAGEGAAIKTRD